MHQYTQYVISEAARRKPRKVSDIHAEATSALTRYLLLKAGLDKHPIDGASWETAEQTVLSLIEEAWLDAGARQHIREMSFLNRLCAALAADGQDWSSVLVAVGDDFNLSGNWPEVSDAHRLFTATRSSAVPTKASRPSVPAIATQTSAAPPEAPQRRRRLFDFLHQPQINPNQITSNPSWDWYRKGPIR